LDEIVEDKDKDDLMRSLVDARVKLTRNQIAARKNMLSDALLRHGFSQKDGDPSGIMTLDNVRIDFRDKISVVVIVLDTKSRWKGEFQTYYSAISYGPLMEIIRLININTNEVLH